MVVCAFFNEEGENQSLLFVERHTLCDIRQGRADLFLEGIPEFQLNCQVDNLLDGTD